MARPSYGRNYLNSISSGAWEGVEMGRINRDSDAGSSDSGEEEY